MRQQNESLIFKSKKIYSKKQQEKSSMVQFMSNFQSECFLRVLKFIPFYLAFSKFAILNKQSRLLIMNSYKQICKERTMNLDLSETTKKLKRTPNYIIKRLNYLVVKMR
jgi:hypothetical protein